MKPSQVKHVTVSNFTCYYLCQIVVWSPSKTTVHCIGRHSPGFYYVTYVHNAYVGILAENIRSSFCVVKFYAIKKACELVGIKFLLISNSFYLTWVLPLEIAYIYATFVYELAEEVYKMGVCRYTEKEYPVTCSLEPRE